MGVGVATAVFVTSYAGIIGFLSLYEKGTCIMIVIEAV